MVALVAAETVEDVMNLKCPDLGKTEYMRIEKEFYEISSEERLDTFLSGEDSTYLKNLMYV